MPQPAPIVVPSPPRRGVWALSIWLAGAALLALLDNTLDLANLALDPGAGVRHWRRCGPRPGPRSRPVRWRCWPSTWRFVPPRGSFTVDLHQHALLLATMLMVSWIVALLMARQRRLARAGASRTRSDSEAAAPARRAPARGRRTGGAGRRVPPRPCQQATAQRRPPCCCRPRGVGRPVIADWRGRRRRSRRPAPVPAARRGHGAGHRTSRGAAGLVPADARPRRRASAPRCCARAPAAPTQPSCASHAQALCDQMGLALRARRGLDAGRRSTRAGPDPGAAQHAARGHRARSPHAAGHHPRRGIVAARPGRAPERRSSGSRLAATIVDEAAQLARLTDNTLQLARLDAPGARAAAATGSRPRRWSAPCCAALRQRDPSQRVRARVEPGLPLLRCDAVLMVAAARQPGRQRAEVRRRRRRRWRSSARRVGDAGGDRGA